MTYDNLSTAGFTVIPSFFNNKEIETFLHDYRGSEQSDCINYHITRATHPALSTVREKINTTLEEITRGSTLKVDYMVPTVNYFDTTRIDRSEFHQDYEPFYILQQNLNYVNFWIPIIKPVANKSGLVVIPMDKLIERAPEFKDRIVGNGASSYYTDGNVTHVKNYNLDIEYVIPFNLDTIAVAPDLTPGDALIITGDLLHRTQDVTTKRVAISIRATNGSYPIKREPLYTGSEFKLKKLAGCRSVYDAFNRGCTQHHKDQLTPEEFYGKWWD